MLGRGVGSYRGLKCVLDEDDIRVLNSAMKCTTLSDDREKIGKMNHYLNKQQKITCHKNINFNR